MGKNVQQGNINAGKAIGDVVRTCLGPRAMLKMLMDPMGGIVMTNDGNAILREITVQHPAAKTMIEIARTQDEEVGDGTTSVIVLAAEMLGVSHQFLEVRKIGDEYFTFIEQCKDPKACTILLRGASKDILNEVERNLQDALNVARNLYQEPALVPGGGATEMEVAHLLTQKAKTLNGVIQWPYKAVASGLEVIPRTLAQNCGANTIRTLALRAKHANEEEKNVNWGINGESGELADMSALGIWEPLSVKLQVYKTAIETAILLLRIDDIVSGSKKKGDVGAQGPAVDHGAAPPDMPEM